MSGELMRAAALTGRGNFSTGRFAGAVEPPMGGLVDAGTASLWRVAQSERKVIQSQSVVLAASYPVDETPSAGRGRYVSLDATRQAGGAVSVRIASEQVVDGLSASLQSTARPGCDNACRIGRVAQILAPSRLVKDDGREPVPASRHRSALAVGRLNSSILGFELGERPWRVPESAQDRVRGRVGDEPKLAVRAPINYKVVAGDIAAERHVDLFYHCSHDGKSAAWHWGFRRPGIAATLHAIGDADGRRSRRLLRLRAFASRSWLENAHWRSSSTVELERGVRK